MTNAPQSNVEIIPKGDVTEGIEKTIGDNESLIARVDPLVTQARNLVVSWPDKDSYMKAGELLNQITSIKKEGEANWAPFNIKVNRVRDFLKQKLQSLTNRTQEGEAHLREKMRAWEIAEKNAAKKEEKQVNKMRFTPATVKPDIPATPGYRRSTTWGAYVENADKLLKAWVDATGKEKAYLRRFITVDEQALRQEARDVKDPDGLTKRIPGVKFTEE